MSRTQNSFVARVTHLGVLTAAGFALIVTAMPSPVSAGQVQGQVTFTKDIAPILQRSCQNCHRPNSVAPMSLITYEDVRPWARSIKLRTGLRNRMGVMPPWFIEKNVGIQDYKDDISLSEEQIATIAKWVDNGAPRGNPEAMPPPLVFTAADKWDLGEPDLIVDTPSIAMKAQAPDWWGALAPTPTGLTEDRYVSAVQIKEVSSVKGGTGGRFIFHHAIHSMIDAKGNPTEGIGSPHEVGRNAEIFEPEAGRLMKAGALLVFPSVHMHANNEDTTAHLRVAYKFHSKGYKPKRRVGGLTFGNGEIDLRPMEAGQEVHLYATLLEHTKLTTFEPHMHASGVRMCIEAIWGGRTETLSCAGYDHNWVRVYKYADDAAPLLPKGTLLHVTAYFDNTPDNKNVVDPRNWGGLGHRSIDNMAILIAPTITLTDEELREEIAIRRQRLNLPKGQTVLGCPLCGFDELPAMGTPVRGASQNRERGQAQVPNQP
jgi:mono/diheme cytochrome c family protein